MTFPLRSPDLTIPDFFLCGWLKTEVYPTGPRTLRELERRIKKVIAALPQNSLQATAEALPHGAGVCLSLRGGHLETVLRPLEGAWPPPSVNLCLRNFTKHFLKQLLP